MRLITIKVCLSSQKLENTFFVKITRDYKFNSLQRIPLFLIKQGQLNLSVEQQNQTKKVKLEFTFYLIRWFKKL